MYRFNLSIPNKQHNQLLEMRAVSDISETEYIRRAIDEYLDRHYIEIVTFEYAGKLKENNVVYEVNK